LSCTQFAEPDTILTSIIEMQATREHIDPGTKSGFLTRKLSMPRFDSVYHFHPEYELTWIQGSAGRILVGDYLGAFGPGHLALLGPHLTHWYYNDPNLEGGNDWSRARLIQFSRDFFGESILRQPDLQAVDQLLRSASRGILFEAPSPVISRSIRAVFKAEGTRRVTSLLHLLDQLAHAPGKAPLASTAYADQPLPTESRRLGRVFEHISLNVTKPIALGELAGLAHMSPSAFSRFFHKRVGLPVSRYILLQRLTRAARELIETNRTVSEIAFAAGFNHLTHFNRQFKQWKGMTPSAFRKLLVVL